MKYFIPNSYVIIITILILGCVARNKKSNIPSLFYVTPNSGIPMPTTKYFMNYGKYYTVQKCINDYPFCDSTTREISKQDYLNAYKNANYPKNTPAP